MLAKLKRKWQRRMLKDPRYATLFVDDRQEWSAWTAKPPA
jgi:DNA polymerase-3 subunit epsilon